jgi:hypothetical protein
MPLPVSRSGNPGLNEKTLQGLPRPLAQVGIHRLPGVAALQLVLIRLRLLVALLSAREISGY